jgi:predicted GNAT family acetyltransferase
VAANSAGGATQQVSLTRLDAGGDINTNISFVYNDRPPEEREIAEALISDVLRLAGVADLVEQAAALRADDRHGEAATILVAVARQLEEHGYGIVGEFSVEQAAEAFAEAGDRHEAVALTEEIIRRRLERADSRAEWDARRLERYLDDEQQWRAEGFTARAVWPEQPEAAVAVLEEALARAQSTAEELEWAAALIDILLALGRFADAHAHADSVRQRFPDLTAADGTGNPLRLAIELDYLDARLELDDDVCGLDQSWRELLDALERQEPSLDPAAMARAWQRRAVMFGRSDRPEEARSAYVRAIKEWNREASNEEQIKEAFFSLERIALLSGTWRGETQQIRAYASRLRGRNESAATLADRLERQGLHARLAEDKLPDARRAYWLAYAVSRAAGNFYEQTSAAELLAELYQTASRPVEALGFLIEAGKEKEAKQLTKELAKELPGDSVLPALRLRGPIWERTVSYAVLGEIGNRLSDNEVAELVPGLLAVARTPSTSRNWPQPSLTARAALAAMAIAVPEDSITEVCDLLVDERRTPNADEAMRTLLRLTNVGRVDETARVGELLFDETTMLGSPATFVHWLGSRLGDYPEVQELVRAKARDGNGWALETMAIAELIANDEEIIARVDARVEAFLARRSHEETVEGGRVTRVVRLGSTAGIGVTARFCSPELHERLLDHLLAAVADDDDAEVNRANAADTLYNFAGVISAEAARRALPLLAKVGRGEHGHSELDPPHGSRDPFARSWIAWNTDDALRSSALGAAARIAARAELNEQELTEARLVESLDLALDSNRARMVAAALDGYAWLPQLEPPLSFAEAFAHSDANVRQAALRLFSTRQSLPPFEEFAALAVADHDVNVRASICLVAVEAGESGRPVVAALADDVDTFVRWRASAVSSSGSPRRTLAQADASDRSAAELVRQHATQPGSPESSSPCG